MEVVSEVGCFGGTQGVYRHASAATNCEMTFGLYLPPQAAKGPVPLLWMLGGLTSSHENAMVKGGLQIHAARHGLALCFPDTSPRGEGVPDDPDDFAMGQAAGYYLDATQDPWAKHFQMKSYLTEELHDLVQGNFSVSTSQGMMGYSMGGLGALTCALRAPERYRSLSAVAPMASPSTSDWGRPQFTAYLGADETAWADYDPTLLMAAKGYPGPVLIDQGTNDPFFDKLQPEALARAMADRHQPGSFRFQPGYDHSYFFVSTFAGDHIAFHAEQLG